MSLRDRLAAQIAAGGPINVAQYMTACLHDPQFGYYATRPALGPQGDFVTAIPGTTRLDHLADNLNAGNIRLDSETQNRVAALFARDRVHGTRYNAATQAEIDTEEWPT